MRIAGVASGVLVGLCPADLANSGAQVDAALAWADNKIICPTICGYAAKMGPWGQCLSRRTPARRRRGISALNSPSAPMLGASGGGPPFGPADFWTSSVAQRLMSRK